jgi:flagellar hook-associated protein FlgK
MNKQLAKHSSEASQPSELLDQRDLLMRELSSLISVKTRFETNGAVIVSVGDTLDQGILVNQTTSRAITVMQSSLDSTKVEFVIDAYGKPETMAGITSGKIGGVMSFRDQVLNPASDSLDNLAIAVTREVNQVHRDGLDAEGQILIADEIHTPDSSRYWIASGYQAAFEAGTRPPSFDKDVIRSWVGARCDPYKDPIPEIPAEMIEKTSRVYIDAYEQITGETFVPDLSGETPLARVRANLAPWFA